MLKSEPALGSLDPEKGKGLRGLGFWGLGVWGFRVWGFRG